MVQFSRGTNFNCFATAGDGSIVVGSKDGKVRLYGTTSMRMVNTQGSSQFQLSSFLIIAVFLL
jgi:hypothetical protein